MPQHARIENRAAIQFDYNAFIITNTVFNTIDYDLKEEDINKPQLFIYPNPAKDMLYFTGLDNSHVSIITTSGRIIIQKNNFSGSHLNISNLSQGAYIVNVRTNKGQYIRKKIMIL